MRLFECSRGDLINPIAVTRCRVSASEGIPTVVFEFTNGLMMTLPFESKSYAQSELKAFKEHCNNE